MSDSIPTEAGDVYGRVLVHLDDASLAGWSQASGFKLHLSRLYARLFGFPELAGHRRFHPLQELLRRHGGNRVLDLGAGNGLYSIADAVRRPGSKHVLVDVSVRHMHRASATGRTLGLPLWGVTCSVEALPLGTASLDTVLLIEVLQFVDDDQAALREIGRVLRPGGVWVCEQDNPPPGTIMVTVEERRLQKRRPGYSVEALRTLAAAAGMDLEYSRIVSGRVGRWWESVDGRLFGRSRALHSLLFPFVRLFSWLTTPHPVQGEFGTVLYLFRKQGAAAVASGRTREQ